MSNLDVVQMVVQERDRLNKERERLFSSDLNEKIARYEELSRELAALSEEIARLAGHSKEASATAEGPNPRGRKRGGRKLEDAEVESGVLNVLRTKCQGKGASVAYIARELKKDFLSDFPLSTIRDRVSNFLKGDLLKPNTRFRNEGELGTSKWFFIAAE